MSQSALAVVREQHHVVPWQLALEVGQHLRQHLVVGFPFKVDAQQLLVAADHAQLDDGLQGRVLAQHGSHALFSQ